MFEFHEISTYISAVYKILIWLNLFDKTFSSSFLMFDQYQASGIFATKHLSVTPRAVVATQL